MKTFKDLNFIKHEHYPTYSTQAIMEFSNGYGISLITGHGAYANEQKPYEIAVLFKGDEGFGITYSSGLTENVKGYLNEQEVTDFMIAIQKLIN